jgi:hypothetical protein
VIWKHEPVVGDQIQKRLLVIGCPKSGTKFYAELLESWGFRIRHERMGEDGTVNSGWLMRKLVDDPLLVGKGRQHYEFDRIIHLVRHPLACIDSMRRELSRQFWEWQQIHSGIEVVPGNLETLAAFWLYWTDGCERGSDLRVRLEDIQHLKPRANAGLEEPYAIKVEDLGSMAAEIESRLILYGYPWRSQALKAAG